MTASIFISDWTTITALGIGKQPFEDALRGDGIRADYQSSGKLEINIAETLGRKGTRLYDRITSLVALAVSALVDPEDLDGGSDAHGIVLGTANGGLSTLREFSRAAFSQERAINPAVFPATIMNHAAGQTAIRFGLRGPNATIANDSLSGASALTYACRLLRASHADVVYCGAVEEWAAPGMNRGLVDDANSIFPFAESCAFVRLTRNTPNGAIARIVHIAERRYDTDEPGDVRNALRLVINESLDRARVASDGLRVIVTAGIGSDTLHRIESEVAGEYLDAQLVQPGLIFGNTGSASMAIAVASCLVFLPETQGYGICLGIGARSVSAILLESVQKESE